MAEERPEAPRPFHYRGAPLASVPRELDPAEYEVSREKRQAEAERLAIRARLKRQFQLQLNDPHRTGLIEDPALTRWNYARTINIYPNVRTTPKTSLMGFVSGILPIVFWWFVFKTERGYREKLIEEGKYEQNFKLYY